MTQKTRPTLATQTCQFRDIFVCIISNKLLDVKGVSRVFPSVKSLQWRAVFPQQVRVSYINMTRYLHTDRHVLMCMYIYIYVYIYMCVCACPFFQYKSILIFSDIYLFHIFLFFIFLLFTLFVHLFT